MVAPIIWKDVLGFEGLYEVSNNGLIRSVDHYVNCNSGKRLVKGKILKVCDRGNGYPFVTVGKNGKQYNLSIHRAVATAFIPNPFNLPEVNHKDTNPGNSDVSNLEWCDRIYNNNYGNRIEKAISKIRKSVIQISNNKVIAEYVSITEASNKTGIHIANISNCCSGKRNSAGGYQWKIKEEKKWVSQS